MTYVELINEFWLKDEEYSFSGSETRLYFYLLKYANSKRWQVNPLAFADGDLMRSIRITANTLKEARNRLATTGLIRLDVKKQNQKGRKGKDIKCRYSLIGVKLSIIDKKTDNSTDNIGDNSTDNFGDNSTDNKPPSTPYIVKEDIDKEEEVKELKAANAALVSRLESLELYLKKKEKKETPPDSGPPPSLHYPFDSDEFMLVWSELLKQKHHKKKTISQQQAMLKLLSDYDEEFAIDLLTKAIAGDYQGIVFSDTKDNYQKYLKSKNGQSSIFGQSGKSASRQDRDTQIRNDLAQYYKENGNN